MSPKLSYLLMALFSALSSHPHACEVQKAAKVSSVRLLEPGHSELTTSFYLRSDHYAMFVERAALASYLDAQIKKFGRNTDRQLLTEVDRAADVGWPIDIFSLAFPNPLFLQTLNRAVADLLQSGKATILDVHWLPSESERVLTSLRIITVSDGSYASRTFCTEAGDQLLKVVDSIE